MAGILWPAGLQHDINGAHFSKCSICPFQLVRTSEIQFAFLKGIEVGERVLNQVGC